MANNIASNQNQGPPVSIPNHAVNKPAVPASNRKPSITNDKQPTIPIQSVAPTTVPHPPKSVAVPAPSPDTPKPAVISPLATTYTDPLEHSLASLESDIIKSEPLDNIVQLPPTITTPIPNPNHPIKTEPLDSISTNMVQMTPVVTNPLGNPNVNSNPNLNPPVLQSGMGMDIKAPSIALGNMLSTNSMLQGMHGNMDHDNIQQMVHSNMNSTNIIHPTNNGFNIKHEFDMPTNNNGLSSMGIPINMTIPSLFDPIPQPVQKKEQPLLQPKPIEELTENVPNLLMDNNKKPTPPEHKHSQSFGFKPKQEQNVKNASSWSSLAQANSPQNTASSGTNSRQQVMDSFKAFQNKAKEKLDREKQRLESLELKRQQKEQAEKERLRVENERRREREEEDALEKAR